ncbi:Tf2-9, partial [Mucuna pruriens]
MGIKEPTESGMIDLLKEFKGVFLEDIALRLAPLTGIEHHIDLSLEVTLPNKATYKMNPKERNEIQKQVVKLLEKGWVRVYEPMHPIRHLDDLLDELHGSQMFSKNDLKSRYHSIRVGEGDEWKIVLPFGLTNAPSIFMRLMNHVLRRLIGKCVIAYFDDILIYSTCLNDHLLRVSTSPAPSKWGIHSKVSIGALLSPLCMDDK